MIFKYMLKFYILSSVSSFFFDLIPFNSVIFNLTMKIIDKLSHYLLLKISLCLNAQS